MTLGFIGTGTIAEAIIDGLAGTAHPVSAILVSPRNADIAARLAERHVHVRIADGNQAVIDGADTVFLAVRPQIAAEVLGALRFRAGQQVVSLIAATSAETLRGWVGPDVTLTQAIPLPFVAQQQGVTAVFPPTPQVMALFDALGTAVPISTQAEYELAGVGSALMGTFFGLLETASGWLAAQGMAPEAARSYVESLVGSVTDVARRHPDRELSVLRADHSTAGGINEQMHAQFTAQGGSTALAHAMQSVLARISGQGTSPER